MFTQTQTTQTTQTFLSQFHLEHRVKIIIPTTRRVDQKLTLAEKTRWADTVVKAMAKKFGGATRRDSIGAYMADNGELVIEHVYEVESSVSSNNLSTVRFMFRLAQIIARALSQESVALYIDNKLYFVEK